MNVLSIVLQTVLGLAFIMSGFSKFNSKQMVEEFQRYRLSPAFRVFTGIVEIIGAAGLIIGIWMDDIAVYAALVLAITMFFAFLTHLIRVNDPFSKLMPSIVLLILNLVVVFINWV